MTITYSLDENVNDRLRISDADFKDVSETDVIDAYRVRAKEDIDLELDSQEITIPSDPADLSGRDVILKDVEADLAAAEYREDRLELMEDARPDRDKSAVWKKRAEKKFARYIRKMTEDELIRPTKESED